MTRILVLYYSRGGSTRRLARLIARGAESVSGCESMVRTVAPLTDDAGDAQPPEDALVSRQDLRDCDALALGSPTRFGNMAAPLKQFLDGTSSEWLSGSLVNKPACVFTSTSTVHGGQESTLLTMMMPLLHHGMLIAGLPFTLKGIHGDNAGGGPYGVSHYNGEHGREVSKSTRSLCTAQGRRLAILAKAIAQATDTD